MLHISNTLSNRREEFQPQDAKRITMYVCGPTVYGPVHVGNARPATVFDLLFRLLRRNYGDTAICYARNITDIDDKIIAAASEAGEPPADIARKWRDDYQQHMSSLRVLPPTEEPHATDYIPQMQAMITRLLEKDIAYIAAGHVLFHVPSFPHYGALSNRRTEDMLAGARVEVAPHKKSPSDFVLWKPSDDNMPGWESPWGRGRPGWHIECSAMAAACLGKEIDIHGGGQDLIFPHHENEIAQSCCANGGQFAHYWMHNGHVNMDGEKMSKSLGNTRLLKDALARFPGEAVRYALLSAHYHSPLNWTERLLEDAKSALDRLYRALGDSPETLAAKNKASADAGAGADDSSVLSCLEDDLNTPQAFSALHELAHEANKTDTDESRARLLAAGQLMGFFYNSPAEWFHSAPGMADTDIEALIVARRAAREQRDFAAADVIRKQLSDTGIVLEDSATGTSWRRA